MTALPHASLVGWLRLTVVACAIILLSRGAGAQTTQPFRPTLFACGSADRYWIASVESYREGTKVHFKTLVRGQTLPGGIWEDMGVVYGHTAGMTEVQDELAVLLDDGSWKRVGPAGLSTGPAIPGSGPVLAWGSAVSVLYTIRAVEGGKDAVTTRPVDTTQPARSTTLPTSGPTTMAATRIVASTGPTSQPTTRPLALALLRLDNGQWVGAADLPAGVGLASLTLWGVGKQAVLAALEDSGAIRTWILVNSKWEDWGEIRPGGHPGIVGGFAMGNTAAIWTMDQDGGVKLFMRREGEEWTAAKSFLLPKSLPEGSQRTLAAAGEEIRLILLKDGKMWEQRYDAAGTMRGGLTELSAPQIYKENPMVRVFQLVVLLAMVIVMVVTFYKRRGTGGEKEEKP
jgi:hypothetical protein